jgi:ABC-2 type transport system ATP-binding protein
MSKILEVKKINKILAKKEVLKDVSFSVKAGEIYGFL